MEDAYSSHLQLAQRLNRHLGLWLGSLDLCMLVSSLHRLLPIAMKIQGIVSIVRMAIITFSKALAELETHRQRAAEYQPTMIVYVIVAPSQFLKAYCAKSNMAPSESHWSFRGDHVDTIIGLIWSSRDGNCAL